MLLTWPIVVKTKIYTAQEVADILGIHKRTLINYENKGVFPAAKRNPVNKWRQFSEKDVKKLRDILQR